MDGIIGCTSYQSKALDITLYIDLYDCKYILYMINTILGAQHYIEIHSIFILDMLITSNENGYWNILAS